MSGWKLDRVLALHMAVVIALLALRFVLPEYHSGVIARALVLAIYALGYNILFGYTGLLSLGHALYFAAGLYGAGLCMTHLDFPAPAGFIAGVLVALLMATLVGLLALRTLGVAFMIVTMMFAQAGYLTLLYFNDITRGDEGFVISQAKRMVNIAAHNIDFSQADTRYITAWALFSTCLILKLVIVRSSTGKAFIAIRENQQRASLLGYNVYSYKLQAFVISGAFAGVAGAAYALLFGYAGASFASIQYSILPLLWVLLGGAGVVLGPLLGTLGMTYLIDYLSEFTVAYLFFVGLALVLLVLIAPRGILGTLRRRNIVNLP